MVAAPEDAGAADGFDPSLGASYRLVRRIGAGASGQVWLAVDTRTGENVAAKLLRPEHATDHDIVTRFVGERSVLTSLRHPGIVAVRDLVVEGDRVAIVMDYVSGGALRDVLDRERTLPPLIAAGVVALVLDAVAAAHERGVLHRDIKPDNILLTERWRELRIGEVKLTDFGIARLVEKQDRRTTGLLGTPEYMPPELIAAGECSWPGDVYAAGIMLYELLTGRTPFAGPGTAFTVAQRHLTADPPAVPVPDELWSVLRSLLDKDPDARPSAAAVAARLRSLSTTLEGQPALEPTTVPERFEEAERPATVLRGASATIEPSRPDGDEAPESSGPAPDLGEAPHATIYRARPQPSSRPAGTAGVPGPERASRRRSWWHRPWWRKPVVLASAGAMMVLVLAAVYLLSNPSTGPAGGATAAAHGTVTATEQGPAAPTGLTVSRSATWNPADHRAEITLTYSAQNGALRGPFLEILPGAEKSSACPPVNWAGRAQDRNLPSITGITAACGWSVDPGPIAAQATRTVKATFPLTLPGADPHGALQRWLDSASDATAAAVDDGTVTSTAYPVQRLQSIQVSTPPAVVTQSNIPITLVPVWPSGADPLNPLRQGTSISAPSNLLTAVAGGTGTVRFSDGCGGAVAVSPDGLSVTALTATPSCVVNARVGNFADLASPPFAIVTRGD